jgi:hypothetical protein
VVEGDVLEHKFDVAWVKLAKDTDRHVETRIDKCQIFGVQDVYNLVSVALFVHWDSRIACEDDFIIQLIIQIRL